MIGHDGFKKITGTKIHVAVDSNELSISIIIGSTNIHDSTKFIDVIENISDFLDNSMMNQIVSVYADKGYDAKSIRSYLKNRNINPCIPFRKNSNEATKNKSYKKYNKIRYVVERFFA